VPDSPPASPAEGPPACRLQVCHETRYDYDSPVELAHHLAYLRPRDTPTQQVLDWSLAIDPLPDVSGSQDPPQHGQDGLRHSRDGWGNWRSSFSHSVVHANLVVVSRCTVDLLAPPRLEPRASPRWEEVAARLRYRPGVIDDEERAAVEFSLGSFYAPRDAALRALAEPHFPPGRPLLDGAVALMHAIHDGFAYRPLSTSVATRAPDALALRQGVCQDFAHVMIAALRSLGLSARYVSGYLLTQPPPGQPRLVGADASHAWLSVWCPRQGWVALDPTNAVPAGQDHVTLAWGRDYGDVAPLRGVMRGSGRAVPRVAVTVEPMELMQPVGDEAAAD
jgi:transglutaminase-like putative cysteine protease